MLVKIVGRILGVIQAENAVDIYSYSVDCIVMFFDFADPSILFAVTQLRKKDDGQTADDEKNNRNDA